MFGADKLAVTKLDVDNYATWSTSMKWLLITKGLWGPVDKPKDYVDKEEDQKALALIGLSVQDHHQSTLAKCTTASEAWLALQAVYSAKSNARRLQLKRELHNIKLVAGEPLTKYVSRAKELRDQLLAAGHDVSDEDLAWSTLAGLPGEYDTLVTMLEASDDKPDIDKMLTKLLAVEQRLVRKDESDGTAFYANKPHKKNVHNKTRPTAKECWYCNRPGHFQADCRKKKRDEAQSHRTGATALMAAGGAAGHTTWVVDSGASYHITSRLEGMVNVRQLATNITITFGNGTTAVATTTGDVELETRIRSTGRTSKIILQGVLYIPNVAINLLSVKQASGRGADFIFKNNSCTISFKGNTIAEGRRIADLYCINAIGDQGAVMVAAASETPDLWHRRLGHIGYGSLAKLVQGDMVEGININSKDITAAKAGVCEPCIMAKQHRQPFPTSESTSTERLQLLHMDLCGPLPVTSLGGSKHSHRERERQKRRQAKFAAF